MSWKWFFIGLGVAAVMLLGLWIDGSIAFAFFYITTAISFGIALGTNFGRGSWTTAGWSDIQQQPFPIPPVPRPRLGGFTTGYALLCGVAYYPVLFGLFR